jgi:hypothetical protein
MAVDQRLSRLAHHYFYQTQAISRVFDILVPWVGALQRRPQGQAYRSYASDDRPSWFLRMRD